MNNIYKYAKEEYKNSKNQSGYIIDYMVLVNDNKEYPYINIFYYKNAMDYNCYKITSDGYLLKSDETVNTYNLKIKKKFYLVFRALMHKLFYLKDIDDIESLVEPNFSLLFKDKEDKEYLEMLEKSKSYFYIIKKAASNCLSINYEDTYVKDIVTAITKLEESKVR